LLAAGVAGGGCGSQSGDSKGEAQRVVKQLKSLQKGEILIQGTSARVTGPYEFKPGGYVFSFQRSEAHGEPLTVALESQPNSQAPPYQLLVDSDRGSRTSSVSLSGKLYVHVVEASGEYVLRFRPKQR
jgi:hypothetical protein